MFSPAFLILVFFSSTTHQFISEDGEFSFSFDNFFLNSSFSCCSSNSFFLICSNLRSMAFSSVSSCLRICFSSLRISYTVKDQTSSEASLDELVHRQQYNFFLPLWKAFLLISVLGNTVVYGKVKHKLCAINLYQYQGVRKACRC
jgi:hypothetical protein